VPYLRIQLQPNLRRWPNWHLVPTMGEGHVGVVDALVGRPELLSLHKWHVAAVALPWGHASMHAGHATSSRGRGVGGSWRRSPGGGRGAGGGGEGGMRPWRVPRLDDELWSFFVFFIQDGIFMALALWRRLRWCMRER
jgi:hypothetical protein